MSVFQITTSIVPSDSWLDGVKAEAFTLEHKGGDQGGSGLTIALNNLELWVGEGAALESGTFYLTYTILMLLFDFCLLSWNLGFNVGTGLSA